MARVLVIDDDPAAREVLHKLLSRAGFAVDLAADGVEGSVLYREAPADLVITDILMPEKEGLELIRELKRDYPHSKIIALSGGGSTVNFDFLPLAEKLGADAVLYKPIEREALLSCVQEVLGTTAVEDPPATD